MAFFLRIKDEHSHTVVEHVANNADDTVYVDWAESYGLPQHEWRKSHHLTEWVKENKPEWKVEIKEFDPFTVVFGS